jgi:hypothetical protein
MAAREMALRNGERKKMISELDSEEKDHTATTLRDA